MQKQLIKADADVQRALFLNRLLFESRGSEFVAAFADYVLAKRLQIDVDALQQLLDAAKAVREE